MRYAAPSVNKQSAESDSSAVSTTCGERLSSAPHSARIILW
jgi:hypothetical protein